MHYTHCLEINRNSCPYYLISCLGALIYVRTVYGCTNGASCTHEIFAAAGGSNPQLISRL